LQKILIINCGGTFNKRYNPLTGNLEVPSDSNAVDSILKYFYNLDYELINIIHKDSLDMNSHDREEIVEVINSSNYEKILIIHGTDTMDKTAEFLDEHIEKKMVLVTGAMVPYSIDSIEANSNLSMSIGYLLSDFRIGVFISMHGLIGKHDTIFKNRKIGVFQSK